MKKLNEFDCKEDFLLFAKILEKLKDSHIVATIKQAVKGADGQFSYFDVQQSVAATKTEINISGEYVYIVAKDFTRNDVRKLKTLWETVLHKGTECFKTGEENSFLFQIDIVKDETEKGYVYSFTGVQPIFVSGNGDKDLIFVFSFNDVRCSEDEITMYDVEYEQSQRDAEGDTVHTNFLDEDREGADVTEEASEGEDDDNEDLLDNDDILDTDKYDGLS